MNRPPSDRYPRLAVASLFCLASLAACTTPTREPLGPAAETSAALFATVAALDSGVFDAFNTCADPGQLQKHAAYFAADVEFYHDTGGVTWNRQEMLANTEKYACGNFRRELIAGSLRVYPVKDFGAIAQGAHRFCGFESGSCDGVAEFVMVWRKQGDVWHITRVLSYGHRPL
jgi:hypothetical protein